MSARPRLVKVGAGDTATDAAKVADWPDGLVKCADCCKGRANGNGATYCRVFEMQAPSAANRLCTSFRPHGWPHVSV